MPLDPTPDELAAWADSGDLAPMEDWDIVVADTVDGEVLIRLVEERRAADFFLGCLYIRAGDAVRVGLGSDKRQQLTALADRARASDDAWIRSWAVRVEALITNPESFDYADWCGGGLASRPVSA